jgi:hypothetical protein
MTVLVFITDEPLRLMKNNIFPTIFFAAFLLAGCGSPGARTYAQNPFNPDAKIPRTSTQATGVQKTGKVSDSAAFRAGELSLAAASRPIPGAISYGAGVGVAAALLLGSGGSISAKNIADNSNFLVVAMPLNEASSERDAQLKMGSQLESAITKSLGSNYKTKIEEYDDHYAFGQTLRPRWIRVDGPLCENWSCQINAPIPTATSLQWEGRIEQKKVVTGQEAYVYEKPFNQQSVGLVKITKEYDKDGFVAGKRHYVEGTEIPEFDYAQFFQRISENLPEWAYLRISKKETMPYTLSRGVIVQ